MRLAIVATVFVTSVLSLAVHANGEEKSTTAWKKAEPGTNALLGDDGGGVNTATLCDTADWYRDWLNYEHPPAVRVR